MTVAVIGAGSWGTTLAAMASAHVPTRVWAREEQVVESISERRVNELFLPDIELPEALQVTGDLEAALAGAELVVVAVPSQHVRSVLTVAARYVPAHASVLSVTKGIEPGTNLRMTEVLTQVLDTHDPDEIGVLAGPNLAREVAAGQPSATCIAFRLPERAALAQRVFMGATFRVYTNPDVVGCEIGGAVKNVIAIAAGAADGLGYGMNTKAALVTRGLAELTRLGVAIGGSPLTFLGLAGNGDLVATCSSPQSRNRHVGEQIGKGRGLDDIVSEMRMVAEGVKTAPGVLALAEAAGVDVPICSIVAEILTGDLDPNHVVPRLMSRDAKSELDGLV